LPGTTTVVRVSLPAIGRPIRPADGDDAILIRPPMAVTSCNYYTKASPALQVFHPFSPVWIVFRRIYPPVIGDVGIHWQQDQLPSPVIAHTGLATILFQQCTKRLCRVLLRFLQLQPCPTLRRETKLAAPTRTPSAAPPAACRGPGAGVWRVPGWE